MLFRTFKDHDVEVVIKGDEDAYLYAWKDGEPIEAAVKISVKQDNKLIAVYHRQFKTWNAIHYNHFLKKFLESPSYRSEFLTEGDWQGTILYTSDNGVNKNCEKAIERLYKNKKPKFKDFVALKTYGKDKFSTAKMDTLSRYVSEEELEDIQQEFADEKLVLSTLRWVARGLKVGYAIRKIKTDEEIKSNIKS